MKAFEELIEIAKMPKAQRNLAMRAHTMDSVMKGKSGPAL